MNLSTLKPGESARITKVGGEGALRQHFLDMGVIPGASVTVIKLAPLGDPMELRIHGYELTLRVADAEQIGVERRAASIRRAPAHRFRRKPFSPSPLWEIKTAVKPPSSTS